MEKSNIHRLEIVLWGLLAFLGASAMRAYRPVPLFHDSYLYLNVAQHLREDGKLVTSFVHFDTERSHGRIPAPLTSSPPGYSAVIAAAGFWGNFEGAARIVSTVCYAGTAALLAWALILTGVTGFVRQGMLLLFATNAYALRYATVVLTEPLYMLVSTSAIVALIWTEKRAGTKRAGIAGAVIACSLAGLACWVRYAGYFLVAAVAGYALLRLIVRRNRARTVLPLASLISIALAGGLMLRNAAIVGTWRGGSDMPVSHPMKTVADKYVQAHEELILGQRSIGLGFWGGLLLAGGLAIAVLLALVIVRTVRERKSAEQWMGDWRNVDDAVLLLGLCVLFYTGGMFYAGLRTVISFDRRMFIPELPVYLLLLGLGATWLASGLPPAGAGRIWLKAGLVLIIAGYVGVNAPHWRGTLWLPEQDILAAQFAEPATDGRPLRQWVAANIPATEPMVADNGLATGYLLQHPTLSMIGPEYSPIRWECDEVKKQMERFHARYLVLYKPPCVFRYDVLLRNSRFAAAAVTQQPPGGFVIAAENRCIRILRLGSAEQASAK